MDIDGPRVRFGLLWAAISIPAIVAGPVATAVVFAAVALAAAGQTCRTWKRLDRRPNRPVAIAGATLCALAGSAGPIAVAAAAACIIVAGVASSRLQLPATVSPSGHRSASDNFDARLTITIALLIGTAAAAPAVLRDHAGAVPALVFLAWVHAVDASTFIVGSGSAARWEGMVAGAATAGAIGLAVAAVFVPPFRAPAPWFAAVLTAVGVPAGTVVASMIIGAGRGEASVPGLRRLDAFVVVGPVWVATAGLLLDVG